MMRQSELKKKYDPDTGRYTRQHIWSSERSIFGEGVSQTKLDLLAQKYLEKRLLRLKNR